MRSLKPLENADPFWGPFMRGTSYKYGFRIHYAMTRYSILGGWRMIALVFRPHESSVWFTYERLCDEIPTEGDMAYVVFQAAFEAAHYPIK